jgi:hypothetical protein
MQHTRERPCEFMRHKREGCGTRARRVQPRLVLQGLRVCCTPEKAQAPWRGKVKVHYSDNNDIENMLTSIAFTNPMPRNIIWSHNLKYRIRHSKPLQEPSVPSVSAIKTGRPIFRTTGRVERTHGAEQADARGETDGRARQSRRTRGAELYRVDLSHCEESNTGCKAA